MTQHRILVIGGTGKTGRRVVERLKARNLPVRSGSRSGEPPFDWQDQTTWEAALRGMDSVYISYQPDLAVPGAAADILALTQQAAAAGIRRLVLLTGRGEEEAEKCEQIVQQSDAAWTILRASWFNQNFDEGYLLEPVLSGTVALPFGDVPEPFIDVEDIADAAVAALTEDNHAGQVYELTGPRLITLREAVGEIAKAAGREIRFLPVTAEDYTAGMRAVSVPEDEVWLINYLFTTLMDGRNSRVTDGVQRATGRSPRDFSDYARRAAATGVWSVSENAPA